MPDLFIYLLKANIALTLFYLAYRFGLRRLTFYTLNRYFLLLGIILSATFPLVDLHDLFQKKEALGTAVVHYVPDWSIVRGYVAQPEALTAWQVVTYVLWIGVVVMAIRFVIQVISILKIHSKTTDAVLFHQKVRCMEDNLNPFSFFGNIYVNPAMHPARQLADVIAHEKVHVRGWHSVDIVTAEVNKIFYWFNPGVWLMKRAVVENLEFITDRQILRSGMDRKHYQYSLVTVSGIPHAVQMVNHFNLSHLKKRIMMMNKSRSARVHLLRYLLIVPVIAVTALLISASRATREPVPALQTNGTEQRILSGSPLTLTSDTVPVFPAAVSYEDFLSRNPKVKSLAWTLDRDSAMKRIIIQLKSGKSETYRLASAADARKVARKYGQLPAPPAAPRMQGVPTVGQGAVRPPGSAPASGSVTLSAVKHVPGDTVAGHQPYPNVLYIVDGKPRDSTFMARYVHPEDIKSIDVIKGDEARIWYGPKATSGVILVATNKAASLRSHPPVNQVSFFAAPDSLPHTITFSARQQVTAANPAREPAFASARSFKGDTLKAAFPAGPFPSAKGDRFFPVRDSAAKNNSRIWAGGSKASKQPLFVVDYNIVDSSDLAHTLRSEDIRSISVVKGEKALKLFGDKGANGVILIETKPHPDSARRYRSQSPFE